MGASDELKAMGFMLVQEGDYEKWTGSYNGHQIAISFNVTRDGEQVSKIQHAYGKSPINCTEEIYGAMVKRIRERKLRGTKGVIVWMEELTPRP